MHDDIPVNSDIFSTANVAQKESRGVFIDIKLGADKFVIFPFFFNKLETIELIIKIYICVAVHTNAWRVQIFLREDQHWGQFKIKS